MKLLKSVGAGTLSSHLPVSSTRRGASAWTGATTAGSLMAVRDTLWQYPGCSVAEVYSVCGPCTDTKTRPAFPIPHQNLEHTALKVKQPHNLVYSVPTLTEYSLSFFLHLLARSTFTRFTALLVQSVCFHRVWLYGIGCLVLLLARKIKLNTNTFWEFAEVDFQHLGVLCLVSHPDCCANCFPHCLKFFNFKR